jgi:DNA-directed RNA polymerase subunit RPC12/RpoP
MGMKRHKQFERFTASELYCPKCRKSQPVRERLLLVLPRAELYEYRCVQCGASLGSREVTSPPGVIALR